MRFYTGDESGQIKGIDIDANVSLLEAQNNAAKKLRAVEKAKAAAKNDRTKAIPVDNKDNTSLAGVDVWNLHGSVDRNQGIQQMSSFLWNDSQQAFVVARRNGTIEVISRDEKESLYSFLPEPADDFTKLMNAKHKGKTFRRKEYIGVGANATHFISCTNMGDVRYQSFSDEESAKTIQLSVGTGCMRAHGQKQSLFAVGGYEQVLSLWDAETSTDQPIFTSENVANDFLDMRVPVWNTDIQFLNSDVSNPTLAVSTGYKQIRIYDTRAQKRPVNDWSRSKHPIYHIQPSHTKPELFFADNMGNLQKLDLRNGQVVGAYKGMAGAIKSIALSEDGTKVAASGLDRFLRVYEADGMHRMLHRAYIKQKATQVVWDWDVKDLSQDEIERQEEDTLWEEMGKISESTKRKANSISENSR